MNILVFLQASGYIFLDERACEVNVPPGAELVFKVNSDDLEESVADMLEAAITESGELDVQPSWADHMLQACSGWRSHKGSSLIGHFGK